MAFLDPGTPPDRSGADFSSGWVVSDLKLVVSDINLTKFWTFGTCPESNPDSSPRPSGHLTTWQNLYGHGSGMEPWGMHQNPVIRGVRISFFPTEKNVCFKKH